MYVSKEVTDENGKKEDSEARFTHPQLLCTRFGAENDMRRGDVQCTDHISLDT